MASRFFGRYDHSLDSKGRVILPARFRADFDATVFVTAHDGRCLALWTPDEFELQFEEVRRRQDLSTEDRNFARMWAATSSEEKIDAQGRIMVPARLREYASLEIDSPVLVTGSMDRIELWNPERWEQEIDPYQELLADPGRRTRTPSSGPDSGGAPVEG